MNEKWRVFYYLKNSIVFLFIFLWVFACSPELKQNNSVITTCHLNEDQSGTLLGRWPLAPLQLAFHDGGNFTLSERQTIMEVAEVWNEFFRKSYGFPIFQFLKTDQPVGTQHCSGGQSAILFDSNGFKKPIMIIKRFSGMESKRNNLAIASMCRLAVEGEKLNWMTSGLIELNYQFFFAPGKQPADLRFTVLHELGHLIGLDHSCEIEAENLRTGMPNCVSESINPTYLKAVMFPSTAVSEIRNLNENDQLRANCIYEDSFVK